MSFVYSDVARVIEKLYDQQYEFKSYIIHNIYTCVGSVLVRLHIIFTTYDSVI